MNDVSSFILSYCRVWSGNRKQEDGYHLRKVWETILKERQDEGTDVIQSDHTQFPAYPPKSTVRVTTRYKSRLQRVLFIRKGEKSEAKYFQVQDMQYH